MAAILDLRTPAPPRAWRVLDRRHTTAVQVCVFLGLVGLALLLRWPQVQMIPPFTDETDESLRAWSIVIGELRPLVNDEPYIGAFWNYVVAGLFVMFGPHPELPRLASLAAGALTVGMTYVLGRRLYSPLAGVLAALLLAANGAHILVNSHVAWSNCVTPLFTTLTIWLLIRALDRPASVVRFGAVGLAAGLALQTHPSVVVFLFGAALYGIGRDHRLPLRPVCWAGIVSLLVAYGNVLAYNALYHFDTLAQAQRVGAGYSGGEGIGLEAYGWSVLGSLVLLAQVMSGVVEPRLTAAAYVEDPRIVAAFAVLGLTICWAVVRRQWLLLLIAVPMLVVIPALNQRWQPILAARYLMPLLPLIAVAVGALLAQEARRHFRRPAAQWGVGLTVVGCVAVVHLLSLHGYYRAEIAAGRTNDGPWQMVWRVLDQRRDEEVLIVHADARRLPTGGGGNWGRSLQYLMAVTRIPGSVGRYDAARPIRACDVKTIELRRAKRGRAVNSPPGTPRHEGYWLVRHAPLPGEVRDEPGLLTMAVPYLLPWQQRSLFNPNVPTFETGCGRAG